MIDLTGPPRRSGMSAASGDDEARRGVAGEIIDDLPVALLILHEGAIARVNDGWTALTGLSAEDSIGFDWLDAVHEEDRDLARELIEDCERHRVSAGDLRLRTTDDHTWVHARSRYVGGEPRTWVVTFTEISARKTNELHLLHLATHDELTGLANRAEFTARLENLLQNDVAAERGIAVMFVDLDRFKSINDSNGHAVGDLLLRTVAHRLRQAVRPSDTVARLGGDEFAVVFPNVENATVAARLADRVLMVLSGPVLITGVTLSVGGSVGIALSSGRDVTAAQLLDEADRAMYRAKTSGGNRWRLSDPTDPSPLATATAADESAAQVAADLRALMAALEQRLIVFLDVHGMVPAELTSVTSIGQLVARIWSEIDDLEDSIDRS